MSLANARGHQMGYVRGILTGVPLVLALGATTFAPAIGSFFSHDDFILLRLAKYHWSLDDPPSYFLASQNGLFTPLNNLLFWLEYQVFGLAPVGYVLISVCLHLLNSVLVFNLARLLAQTRYVAGLAAVLFVVGFSHHEATSWIAAYVHLVTALFYIASTIAFITWQRTSSRRHYTLSLFLFALGLFSKEPIVTLPLLLLFWTLLERSPDRKRHLFMVSPFVFLDAMYVVAMICWQFLSSSAVFLSKGIYSLGWHGLTNYRHLVGLVVPPLSAPLRSFFLRSPFPQVIAFYEPLLWVCLLPLGALFGVCLLRGSKVARFCVLWIIITFSPFAFITVGIASRYLYLPAAGFTILVAVVIEQYVVVWLAKPIGRRLIQMGVVVYIGVNMAMFNVWQSQMNDNGRTRHNLIQQVINSQLATLEGNTLCVRNLNPKFSDVDLALPVWLAHPPRFQIDALNDGCKSSLGEVVYLMYTEDGGLSRVNRLPK